jgi:D-xylose transport system substrate-binding protein
VGELQGQYIADNYSKYVTAQGNNNLVMINGAPTDNNALLFKQGALNKLQPLINNNSLKLVYTVMTKDWDNPTAQNEMAGALTANSNKIAVAYVANDGMATTVIAALAQQHLDGKVLVTGQDATVDGIRNILLGKQNMTVYKAISKEADATAKLVAALSKGSDTSSLVNGQTKVTTGSNIPSVLETPVAVDTSNIASTVLADNYVSKSDICQGVPAGTDNIC